MPKMMNLAEYDELYKTSNLHLLVGLIEKILLISNEKCSPTPPHRSSFSNKQALSQNCPCDWCRCSMPRRLPCLYLSFLGWSPKHSDPFHGRSLLWWQFSQWHPLEVLPEKQVCTRQQPLLAQGKCLRRCPFQRPQQKHLRQLDQSSRYLLWWIFSPRQQQSPSEVQRDSALLQRSCQYSIAPEVPQQQVPFWKCQENSFDRLFSGRHGNLHLDWLRQGLGRGQGRILCNSRFLNLPGH